MCCSNSVPLSRCYQEENIQWLEAGGAAPWCQRKNAVLEWAAEAAALAAAMQWQGQDLRPVAPTYGYAAVSLSNVVATTCQYEALKYVTFPLQTLGKCAKMLPVMLWGSVILRKRCASPVPFLAL